MKTAVVTPLETRILLIADDSFFLNKLKQSLENLVSDVQVLQDTQKAIAYLKTTDLDIIVMDVASHYAIELIQSLKKNTATKNIPIITVGNQEQEGQLEIALQYGANDILSAPFLPIELQQRINFQHQFLKLKRDDVESLQTDKDYFLAVDILNEGHMVQNLDDIIISANKAAGTILKYEVNDLVGKSMDSSYFRVAHENGTAFTNDEYPWAIAKKTGTKVTDMVMNVLNGNGKKTTLTVNAAPILSKGETLTGTVITFQDITPIKLAEKQYKSFFKENIMPLYWLEMTNPIPTSLPIKEQVKALFREAIIKDLSMPMVPLYEFEKPEDIIGKPMTNAFSPESVKPGSPIFSFFETMFDNGYVAKDVERFGKNQNNVEKCFLNNATAIIENDHITRIFGSQIDVTKEKITQKSIKESEGFLRAIVENSMNAIMVADDMGNYISANKAAADLFGYSIEELTQMNVTQLKSVNDDVPERYNEYVQKGREVGEWSFLDANNKPKTVQYHAIRVRENFNLSILSDISDKKSVEDALRTSESKFRTLANTAQMGISIITSHNGLRFEYVNKTWEKITGYSQEEAIGLEPTILVHKEYADLTVKRAQERLQGKTPPDKYEMKIVTKSKEIKWVEVRSNLVVFEDQAALLTTSLDITDRKALEQQQLYFKNFMNTSTDLVSYWKMPAGLKTDLPIKKQIDLIYEATLVDCNHALLNFTNQQEKETIIGSKYIDFIREKSIDDQLRSFIENKYKLNNYEATHVLNDGSRKYALGNWYGVIEEGQLTYLWTTSKDHTERKNAELALIASEEKFRNLANTAQVAIAIFSFDQEFGVAYVNTFWEEITEYGEEESLLMNPMHIVHDDDKERVKQIAFKRMKGEAVDPKYEFRLVTKTGKIKWMELYAKIIEFNGKPATLTTAIDISERKEFEKKQLYFSQFMNTSSEVVSYWEVPRGVKSDIALQKQIDLLYNSVCLDCNNAVVKLFEREHKSEVIGKKYIDFVQEKTYDGVYNTFIKNGYKLSNFEAYQILDNGKMKFTLENWHGVFEDNYLKYIWATSTDITERKLAELKLKESETKFYNAFNSSPVALAVVNIKNGERLEVNTEFCSLFGFTHDEAMSLDLEDNALAVDESKLKEALLIANEKGELEDYPLDMRDAAGNIKHILISATNTFLADRDIFIVSYMDMTSIVEAEEKLKKAETQIFQSMVQAEEKERARYAKELHDGLGPILSTSMIYLHTLLKEKDRQKQEGYINRTYTLLEDAMQSIREISSNLSPDILKKYGLVHAVRSFIERLQEVSNVEFKISSNLKNILPDIVGFTLYRTLTELINNSIKHAEASQISIVFEENKQQIKITFADNGKGFDYEKIKKANTGFGLLNLETRIHKIGGKYNFTSSNDSGTKVNIKIQKTEHGSFSYN
ncbi:MAG: PAS domain S-box protein [Croceitalea sp.]|nr:PAS domain S-box protein [Croceitalea sp.]